MRNDWINWSRNVSGRYLEAMGNYVLSQTEATTPPRLGFRTRRYDGGGVVAGGAKGVRCSMGMDLTVTDIPGVTDGF